MLMRQNVDNDVSKDPPVASMLDGSGASSLGSSPGRGHFIMFLGETLKRFLYLSSPGV